MNFPYSGLAACICLLITNNAVAETQKDLGTHEHGASLLNVVIDNDKLLIEFESPWMNLVGFEHRPSTDKQKEDLAQATATLGMPEQLFLVNSEAHCTSLSTQISSSNDDHEDEHQEDAHEDEHEHEEDGHEDEHEHAEDGHEDEHEEHSEVISEYVLLCKTPDKLESLSVELFKLWPGIDDIDVQLVGPSGQTELELDPGNSTIDLLRVH